jgi:GTPase Era involved in 16S rRNA processing
MDESKRPAGRVAPNAAISLAANAIEQFQLTDLRPLLRTVERQAEKRGLNLAVFGRFKAGKSSFLNHVISRELLPVGVVPVTSVITQISFGEEESAFAVLQDGRGTQTVLPAEIVAYISEAENPENRKSVECVSITLPQLRRFAGVTFVDTPGLESTFSQNTEASISWSPNVDLALVVVAVDPPLTQQDVALIERLQRFTPNISILLSKVDTLDRASQREVLRFVKDRLAAKFPGGLPVFPFSIRAGYEQLREQFEREYLLEAAKQFEQHRAESLTRKLQTLFEGILGYLQLALKSADAAEGRREQFRARALGSESTLADHKLQLKLLAKYAVAASRPLIERQLKKTALPQVQQRLAERFAAEFPQWPGSFAKVLARFEDWLAAELNAELSVISNAEHDAFEEPLRDARRQFQNGLQAFRDRLSEESLCTFGIRLRTTEVDIEVQRPSVPDISVGKIFDRNWELLSGIIPLLLFRRAIERQFRKTIEDKVVRNFSRLASQWEEAISSAIHNAEQEAERRLDEFVLTVRRTLCELDRQPRSDVLSCFEKVKAVATSLEHSS